MQIIDLIPDNLKSYFVCLEEYSEEMKDAGDHKERWYNEMKNKGLRVKLAVMDDGKLGGMIHYLPAEQSFIEGEGLYFIPCIWVHGHKAGVGNVQKRGMGKALLAAAEEDARQLGAKGIAAWGLLLPFWMKASWFKKHGFVKADRLGFQILLWKPFEPDLTPPKWIRQQKTPDKIPGKVVVSAFVNGWCPAQNIVFERAKRAAAEFGDKVIFQAYHTIQRHDFLNWGISDGLFIDGKLIQHGPPLSYEKIKSLIAKRVRKL
ncbi:GNAT family N-acetyltransferase [candidate division KSB1 bacterium]|nr:GNAT family N-acetyltransferase [candidate division KSB1 bacterium]